MYKKVALVALAATYLTACTTTDPYTGEQKVSNTAGGAAIGAGMGAVAGLLVGNNPVQRRNAALIGAGLLGTIFSGGRIKGDIRASEAVQKQMLVKYQQTIQTALREVEDALVFNAKAGEIASAGSQQLAALRDTVQLSEARYQGGESSFIDVLDAQQDLYEAQDKQVGRDRDTYLALISIYKAMGGGWMVAHEAPATAGHDTPAQPAAAADAHASTQIRPDSRQ